MMNLEATGTSSAKEPATWIDSTVVDCPSCGAPFRGRPLCSHDGTILGRFTINDRYTVEERLGAGGCAFVYGARHCVLGNAVAIKVLRPEIAADAVQAARFLREARTASQLAHEHLVTIVDFGHDEQLGLLYLVMPRIAGGSLADLIAASAPMPAERAVPILRQIARAVAAAHAVGVTHGDLGPHNVLLASLQPDVVKICDTGLSRQERGGDRVSAQGAILGTTAYLAPEQLRGDGAADRRVDLYGFGATAYHLLTGRLPVDAPTPAAMMMRKLHERTVPPLGVPGVPPVIEQVIRRCLAFDPGERPAGMEDVERALNAEPAASAPASLIGQLVGGYRVVRALAAAGDTALYLGEHPLIGTQLAIKTVPPDRIGSSELADRLVHEARIASQLAGPYVPTYYDAGRTAGGQPYAILDRPRGESLAERLRRPRPELDEVIEVARAAATALAYVHAAGVIHRDLAPANLAIARGDDGRLAAWVLDFGVAARLGGTQDKQVVGTAAYCAPEQALGLEVGPAADVYALGATIFEMLAGAPPFTGESLEVLAQKTTSEPPSLQARRPELPPVVSATLDRMLAREPARRIGSMREVLDAIETWPRRERTAAAAQAPLDDPDRPPRRSRVPVIAAAMVAAAAIVVLAATRGGGAPAPIDPAIAAHPPSVPVGTAAPAPAAPPSPGGPVEPRPDTPAPAVAPPAPEKPHADAKPKVVEVARPATPAASAPAAAHAAAPSAPHAAAPSAPHKDDGLIVDPWK